MSKLRTNVYRGAAMGVLMGSLAAIWVGAASLLGRLDPAARYDITLAALVGIYLLGGVLGGTIVGLLAPLGRWWWGAMFVGVVAAVPFFLAIQVYDHGVGSWTDLDDVLAVSLIIGAPAGLIMRLIIRHVDPFGPLE